MTIPVTNGASAGWFPRRVVVIISMHDDARAQEAQAARVCGGVQRYPDATLDHAPGRVGQPGKRNKELVSSSRCSRVCEGKKGGMLAIKERAKRVPTRCVRL